MMPTLGKIFNEPASVYHSIDAVSRSRLDDLIDFGELYYFKKHVEKSLKEEPKKALDDGIALHTLIIQGQEEFDKQYVVVPDDAPSRPTTRQLQAKNPSPDTIAAIRYWDGFTEKNEGKIIVSGKDVETWTKMREAVLSHPVASALIAGCETEVTWRSKGERFVVQCRTDWFREKTPAELVVLLQKLSNEHHRSMGFSEVDFPEIRLNAGQPYMVDLKSCRDLNGGFAKHYADYNYHRQPAFYRGVMEGFFGLQNVEPFFVAAEKEEPFRVVVHQPDLTSVDTVGFPVIQAAIKRLARCYDTGVWPGAPNTILPVSLPNWKIERELKFYYETNLFIPD